MPGGGIEGFCQQCLVRVVLGSDGLEAVETSDPVQRGGRSPAGGLTIGGYELMEELGRGGMGVVYRARQPALGRDVALKVLKLGPLSDAAALARFRREAAAAAALKAPNIVSIHEFGEDEGHHFYSMELVEGETLAAMTRMGPLPVEVATRYWVQVVAAVVVAHEHGILHRDLKPSNVIVDDRDVARVTDFGLAKLMGDGTGGGGEVTVSGQVVGSPGYLPPEQADARHGRVDFRSDVYSLGALCYHLLTGRPPFAGATIASTLAQVETSDPVAPSRLNPAVPRDLETICLKCLQKEPSRRYADAASLAADLERYQRREPIHARPVPWWERLLLGCRRQPRLAAVTVGLVAAVLAGSGGVLWQAARATASARRARLASYASDIAVASLAVQQGDIARARQLLQALRPAPGEEDLRGFDWRYLWGQSRGQETRVVGVHSNVVTDVAFSKDGSMVASAGRDGAVRIWPLTRAGSPEVFVPGGGTVWTVAFSGDGRSLLAGCDDGWVRLWDRERKGVVRRFAGIGGVFAGDGNVVATVHSRPVFWDAPGAVELWDVLTGERRGTLPGPGKCIASSPGGDLVLITREEAWIEGFDVRTGERRIRRPGRPQMMAPVLDPGGRHLAAVAQDEVLLWDLATEDPPRSLKGHHRKVWDVTFHPRDGLLYSVGSDRSVRGWEVTGGAPRVVLRGHQDEIWAVAMDAAGSSLVTGGKDRSVRLWDPREVRVQGWPHAGWARPMFSDSGALLLTAPGSPGQAGTALWEVETRRCRGMISNAAPLGFNVSGTGVWVWGRRDWAVDLHDVGTTHRVQRLEFETNGLGVNPKELVLDRARRFCLGVDEGGRVAVFEMERGRQRHQLQGPRPGWRSAALTRDGRRGVVCKEGVSSASLIDFGAGVVRELAGHADMVSGVAFSWDERRVATSGADARIKLWNAATGVEEATLEGHLEDATDVAFSPDGRLLASVGFHDCVKLWHLATGRELISIDRPSVGAMLQFSPDGRYLGITHGNMWNESIELLDATVE